MYLKLELQNPTGCCSWLIIDVKRDAQFVSGSDKQFVRPQSSTAPQSSRAGAADASATEAAANAAAAFSSSSPVLPARFVRALVQALSSADWRSDKREHLSSFAPDDRHADVENRFGLGRCASCVTKFKIDSKII